MTGLVCRTCGERYPEAGDGWDGECGNCADRTWAAEHRAEHADTAGCCECGGAHTCQDCPVFTA